MRGDTLFLCGDTLMKNERMKPKLYSRRTKASTSPLCCIQADRFSEGDLFAPCNNHLGNPVTVMDTHFLSSVVYQKYTDFPAVISIDGTRTVENRQTELGSQPAARPYLCLIPYRQLNTQACRYFAIRAAGKHQIFIKAGRKVGAGTVCGTIDRKQCFRSQLHYMNHD